MSGNAHQRAVEKAAKSRVQKQVKKAVAEYFSDHSFPVNSLQSEKQEKSPLGRFFDWTGSAFLTFVTLGMGFLTIPHAYMASRVCFVCAAISLVIKLALAVQGSAFVRVAVAVVASILAGIGVNGADKWVTSLETEQLSRKEERPVIVRPVIPLAEHLYVLNGDREKHFEQALKNHKGHREIIRVGCTSWSEESCVAAGKFLIVFSKAGWQIDSKQVFRMQPQIPIDGVALVSNDPNVANKAKNLPPHLGTWHKMTKSEQTFFWAFNGLNIPVSSSSDLSLASDTLGVYFGPEPQK